MARTINHQSIDVRRTVAMSLGHYAASVPKSLPIDILKVRNILKHANKKS